MKGHNLKTYSLGCAANRPETLKGQEQNRF